MSELSKKLMYSEGIRRFEDGEFLSRKREGDSGYLLKLLGFELLLKNALLTEKEAQNHTHNYLSIYHTLSKDLKSRIVAKAQEISQIFTIRDRIEELLKIYQYNFIQLRYPYQAYANFTEKEYSDYSQLYYDLGCPDDEAEFEYYPEELRGLFLALKEILNEGS